MMNILRLKRSALPAKAPTEDRQAPFTDAVVAGILARAGTAPRDANTGSAIEIAAGLYARALASATMEGASLPVMLLASIGRDMIRHGEAVLVLHEGRFVRGSDWEVSGSSPHKASWRYRVHLPTPGGSVTVTATGDEVAHPRYSTDGSTPWKGIPPLDRATHAGTLLAGLEASLSDEMASTVGYLLPIPTDGQDASVATLREDLQSLKGRTMLVETTAAGWGEGRGGAPQSDWRPQRIGAAPPDSLVNLHASAMSAVLAACGVPVELVHSADGTGQREAWRRFLHGSITPLAALIAEEFSQVLGTGVRFSFEGLFASDIAGRARAFQSLVGGGMDIGQAAELSGLLASDD